MRKRSIKFISILLLLLMSVLCFVACSSDDQGDGLENYKQNAITEITSVRAEYMDSLYSLENIEALNLILEDAKSKISAATEKSQIDIIVSQAKNNFSKINTMKIGKMRIKRNWRFIKDRDKQNLMNIEQC